MKKKLSDLWWTAVVYLVCFAAWGLWVLVESGLLPVQLGNDEGA